MDQYDLMHAKFLLKKLPFLKQCPHCFSDNKINYYDYDTLQFFKIECCKSTIQIDVFTDKTLQVSCFNIITETYKFYYNAGIQNIVELYIREENNKASVKEFNIMLNFNMLETIYGASLSDILDILNIHALFS